MVCDEIYYVSIDDDFVKDRIKKTPLGGVKEGVWYFKTILRAEIPVMKVFVLKGYVQLTPEGTNYFNKLNKTEQQNFESCLSQELTDASGSLVSITATKIDTSSQIKISIDIYNYGYQICV